MKKRIDFWLKYGNADDEWLMDVIAHLKYHRQFAKTVREGIRLILALRAGQLEVLFEMFPYVRYQQLPGTLPPPSYKLPAAADGDIVVQLVDEVLKMVS